MCVCVCLIVGVIVSMCFDSYGSFNSSLNQESKF